MTTSTSTNIISRQIRRGDSYVYVHGHLGSCVRINSIDTNTDSSTRMSPTEARATAAALIEAADFAEGKSGEIAA